MDYKNSSFSRLISLTGESFCSSMAQACSGRLLAFTGQTEMQRIQRMQRDWSVEEGLLAGMACTGHLAAHSPQDMQDALVSGITGICFQSR